MYVCLFGQQVMLGVQVDSMTPPIRYLSHPKIVNFVFVENNGMVIADNHKFAKHLPGKRWLKKYLALRIGIQELKRMNDVSTVT